MGLISAIKNKLFPTTNDHVTQEEMTVEKATQILANMEVSFDPISPEERAAALTMIKSKARPLSETDINIARAAAKKRTDLFVPDCNRLIYQFDTVKFKNKLLSLSLPQNLHHIIHWLLPSEQAALLDHIATISGYGDPE